MSEPTPPPPSAFAIEGSPDWATQAEDIPCPLCEYNLRGLTTPRCPECGYAFTWQSLLESRTTSHPYLFEHHPRRNVRSFFRTTFAGFNPWRFWKTLTASHVIRGRRLILYWLVGAFVAILLFAGSLFPSIQAEVNRWYSWRAMTIQRYMSGMYGPALTRPAAQAATDKWYPPPYTPRGIYNMMRWIGRDLLPALTFYAAWPWVTWLSLLVFRQSMRQAKVRPAQILRCTLYSADLGAVVAAAAVALAWSLARAYAFNGFYRGGLFHPVSVMPVFVLFVLFATTRLAVAYGRYLRFRHAVPTVIASQVVVGLILFNIYLPWVAY